MSQYPNELSYDDSDHTGDHDAPQNWLDIWWPLLVIGYAVLFVIIICSWHPTT